jgi:hypothetical protein
MNIYKPKMDRRAKNIGLFCNARDEKNIKEWAAHHLLIGFDIIIIFDHKSIVPLSDIFSNFDKRVTIIKTTLPDGNIKIKLMNNATQIAKKLDLDWFIYLDADEFLILNNKFRDIKHFLDIYSYADSIGVNWLMFGTNNLINEPTGLILENYTKSSKTLGQHVKSFVRPNEVINSDHPHYYKIRNPYKMLGLTFNIMTKPQCFNKLLTNMPYYMSPAYIAHYVYQSEETYIKRKINITSDLGTKRANLGKEIHNLYNDTENLQPQKYIKQIKEFLHYYENKKIK